jgi:hypothetical protein
VTVPSLAFVDDDAKINWFVLMGMNFMVKRHKHHYRVTIIITIANPIAGHNRNHIKTNGRTSSRVLAPPGGKSSFSFG